VTFEAQPAALGFCVSGPAIPSRGHRRTGADMKHFLNTQDWSRAELDALLARPRASSATSWATS
jgi:hypothetical protein